MGRSIAVVAVAVAIALHAPRPASACSLAENQEQMLDSAHATDITAPSVVTVSAMLYHSEDDGGGCNEVSSCGDIASIGITVMATDNATPTERLGYQIQLVGGEPPRGFRLPTFAVSPFSTDTLWFYYDASDHSGFSMDLEIRARDLNGNLGPPMVLSIEEEPAGGCRTEPAPALGLGTIAVLALVLRRRRRSR